MIIYIFIYIDIDGWVREKEVDKRRFDLIAIECMTGAQTININRIGI